MATEIKPTITDRDFTVASILAPSALVSAEATEEKSEEESTENEQSSETKSEENVKDSDSSEKK